MADSRQMSLYLHVPFCSKKCGYCDFYSVPVEDRNTGPLVGALVTELATRRSEIGQDVPAIFVGGGTPTVLPDDQLARLFAALAPIARAGRTREFTVEANPATLTDTNVAVFHRAGVNRISLGAQSFDPADLAVLERTHDPSDVGPSVAIAREAGITRINLDLIFGIPGQTARAWLKSLDRALELDPDHLACYALTYEPGTTLAARREQHRLQPCDEDLEAEMMLAGRRRLLAAGFQHYEISNYARPGCRCLHNLRYWKNLSYIGIGPAAAGYRDGLRYKNVADVEQYIRMIEQGHSAVTEQETLPARRCAGETAMLNLRLTEGIDIPDFHAQTGFDPRELFRAPIERHTTGGLLAVDHKTICLTEKGLLLADLVMADFLHAAAEDG